MPIELDDVALSKAAIIERCIRRMHQEYRFDPQLQSYTHVDALTLNIERACQAAIDLAMHVVAIQRLGLPKNSANAFALLQKAGLLSADLAEKLKRMTGFRNIAVHEYQEIDTNILHTIATRGWQDFCKFGEALGLRIEP